MIEVDKQSGQLMGTSQTDVAQVFGVSVRAVTHWAAQGMPREDAGERSFRYRVPDIVAWRIGLEVERAKNAQKPRASEKRATAAAASGFEVPDDDPLLFEADSYYGELFRKHKAEAADIDNAIKRGELVARDVIRDMLQHAVQALKRMGERLAREHGDEAARLLNETLDEVEKDLIEKDLANEESPTTSR